MPTGIVPSGSGIRSRGADGGASGESEGVMNDEVGDQLRSARSISRRCTCARWNASNPSPTPT